MSTRSEVVALPRFRHATPAFRTFSGDDALAGLPRELDRLGVRRAVIVCGASIVRHDSALERVQSALGERLAGRFEHVREHSPVLSVQAASRRLADLDADGVVAVGGGSAIVTARAATILLAEGNDPRVLCTRRVDGRLTSPRLSRPKLPQWVVPSTPTTAYAKAGSAVRDPDTGERLALFDPKTRAQGVFLDPEIALTAPVGLALASGLTAFATAVDGLQSDSDDALAHAQLAHALRLLTTWLPVMVADPDAPGPRLQLMAAALLAGQGSDFVGTGLAAAFSHALGPRSSVSNGVIEALLLPHTMEYNRSVTASRLHTVAAAMGTPSPSVERAIAAVSEVLTAVAVPQRLRDVGLDAASLDDVIAHVLDDWFATQVPRQAGPDDLRQILVAAW